METTETSGQTTDAPIRGWGPGPDLIDSPERMIDVVRHFGIIPFFKGAVPGWSIEEMTAPGCWFDDGPDSVILGPWDWKIDVVREGDIAYGKFLGGKAAFATVEWYRELMNWRRSQPRYQMALGKPFKAVSTTDKLMKHLSPHVLEIIRGQGAVETGQLRSLCREAVTPALLRALPARYKTLLSPSVKKNVMDSIIQFLQSGTWIIIGDFERVYRGQDLHYNGWQRASNTTPEALFASVAADSSKQPFWAKYLEQPTGGPGTGGSGNNSLAVPRTPEESRNLLISHVLDFFPSAATETLRKLI